MARVSRSGYKTWLGELGASRLYYLISVIGVVAAVGGVATTFFERISSVSIGAITIERIKAESNNLEKRIVSIETTLEQVGTAAKALQNLPNDAQSRALVVAYDEKINGVQIRLKAVEDSIIQDPQKILSVILLKKEIEYLQKSVDDKLVAQNASIEKLYSIIAWSIGGLIITVIGQVIRGYFEKKQPPEAKA